MPRLADLPATSIVLACDMPPERLKDVARATATVAGIEAYKIGAALALEMGLAEVARTIRAVAPGATLIYDHQKAGTDIPDTAPGFMQALARCGMDSVILFPLAGPATQTAWITAAQEAELDVIVGCHMTHPQFLESEGGYVADSAVARAYKMARDRGVTDFVVPGNKPEVIEIIRSQIEAPGDKLRYFAPGFVAQAGEITAAAKAAGSNWHAIVGRGIFGSPNPAEAARQLTAKL